MFLPNQQDVLKLICELGQLYTMSYSWNTTGQQAAQQLRAQIEGKIGASPVFYLDASSPLLIAYRT